MQTAMIEVKYVNPPKEGKQYGSIKGTDNDSWPVKADRIKEFEPNNKYELAYTEGNNGFRNIIGVKRIVPEVDAPRGRGQQGHFEEFDANRPTQRNGATLTPSSGPAAAPKTAPPANGYYRPTAPKDSERMWTCAVLGHVIDRGGVELTEDALIHAVNTLRAVYQKTYGQDDN